MIYKAFLKRFINAKTVHNYEPFHEAFKNWFTIVGLILNVFTNRKGFTIKEKKPTNVRLQEDLNR